MKRIGIAASKIAKGNLLLYNFFVILITLLFSLLLFLISGSSIVIALVILAYLTSAGALPDLEKGWIPTMIICMRFLAAVIGLLVFSALAINIRLRKHE